MARIEDVERRLQNWARWKVSRGAGHMGFAGVNWGADVGTRSAYRESKIPTSDCEAEETDRAVLSLAGPLRAAVVEVYTGRGFVADHLNRLQCSHRTMYARIDQAHRVLDAWFMAAEQARREERRRVEELSRLSRKDFST